MGLVEMVVPIFLFYCFFDGVGFCLLIYFLFHGWVQHVGEGWVVGLPLYELSCVGVCCLVEVG